MNKAPRILIIAGPNGAGKTTFAREFLPQEADCPIFVNADLIAAGLAPFARRGHRAGRGTRAPGWPLDSRGSDSPPVCGGTRKLRRAVCPVGG
jgi:hypothetical protein